MAGNFLTDAFRNNMIGSNTFANVQLDADTIAIMFIDNAEDIIVPTDSSLSDVISSARAPTAAASPPLTVKTLGLVGVGVFDAADTTFNGLAADQCEQLLMFKKTGTDSTSILIACWDTFTSGMPITPNGGDISIQWNSAGIFSV